MRYFNVWCKSKNFLCGLAAGFLLLIPAFVQAAWWDDVVGAAEDIECIIDLSVDFEFSFSDEEPVFDGPGTKKGARLVRCQLDDNISKEKDLRKLIIGWMNFLLGLTAVLAVVALVWAGFTYVTAMGDDSRIETAKNVVIWTVVGILLILGAYAIVNTLMEARFGSTLGLLPDSFLIFFS